MEYKIFCSVPYIFVFQNTVADSPRLHIHRNGGAVLFEILIPQEREGNGWATAEFFTRWIFGLAILFSEDIWLWYFSRIYLLFTDKKCLSPKIRLLLFEPINRKKKKLGTRLLLKKLSKSNQLLVLPTTNGREMYHGLRKLETANQTDVRSALIPIRF